MTAAPPFTRTDLAKLREIGGQFKELREVKWINPREFHRKAVADIEDLGYNVGRGLTEGISIQREAIGEKTGHVESWVAGRKDIAVPAVALWTPYQLPGWICVGIGALLTLIGMAGVWALLLIGLALGGLGIYLAMYKKKENFLMHGVLSLKLLANGEATERTIQRPGANVTDLFAQLTVAFAFMQKYEIRAHEIVNPTFKLHLEKQVAAKLAAFPQLQDLAVRHRGNLASTSWAAMQAPTAEYLTEDAKKLLSSQSALIGPDFNHLTASIERYGTGIENVTQPGEVPIKFGMKTG